MATHAVTLIAPLVLTVLVAGCGTAIPPSLPVGTPSPVCDFRMIDHNRRACGERGGTFQDPVPGSASCGTCVRSQTYEVPRNVLCVSTGWVVTCTEVEEMPAR